MAHFKTSSHRLTGVQQLPEGDILANEVHNQQLTMCHRKPTSIRSTNDCATQRENVLACLSSQSQITSCAFFATDSLAKPARVSVAYPAANNLVAFRTLQCRLAFPLVFAART